MCVCVCVYVHVRVLYDYYYLSDVFFWPPTVCGIIFTVWCIHAFNLVYMCGAFDLYQRFVVIFSGYTNKYEAETREEEREKTLRTM